MTVSKHDIRAALDRAQADFQTLIEELAPTDFQESLGPGQWTVQQCFAHIARAELVHLRLARLARRGVSLRFPDRVVPHVVRTFNALQQQLLRRKTATTLIADQRRGRAALLAFLDRCTEADLARNCFQMHNKTWAPLGEFLFHVAEHQEHHVADIRAALQRQGQEV